MKTLIRLELRRTNFRTYVISALIIAVIMLGFLYLFAYAPMLETNDADMKIFVRCFEYDGILCIGCCYIFKNYH